MRRWGILHPLPAGRRLHQHLRNAGRLRHVRQGVQRAGPDHPVRRPGCVYAANPLSVPRQLGIAIGVPWCMRELKAAEIGPVC